MLVAEKPEWRKSISIAKNHGDTIMTTLNHIYNENCLQTMVKMADNFVDLTVTSPPYNLGNTHHTDKNRFTAYDVHDDAMPETAYQNNQIDVLQELYRVTKPTGSLMYNHKNRIKNGSQITPYEWLLKTSWNIKQELVWFNGTPNMDNIRFYPMTERIYWLTKTTETGFENKGRWHDLISLVGEGTDGKHKRSFPLRLAQLLISGFDSAQIIYDPYMGSGTTAVAAHKLGRDYIGSEISQEYVDLANKRIEPYLAQESLFQETVMLRKNATKPSCISPNR